MKRTSVCGIALSTLWLLGCGSEGGILGGSIPLQDAVAPPKLPAATTKARQLRGLSPAGLAAARAVARTSGPIRFSGADEHCINTPDCADEDTGFTLEASPAGTRSEVSLAVDSTGQHIVVGFNDDRGFNDMPVSVSGFMYSDDGGKTFTDGGQLHSDAAAVSYGDPDVKYLGGCNFVYSEILVVTKTSGMMTTQVQSMGFHRSTDCGHTWQGPFEITAATVAGSAADKEFIDVDPDTGRVMVSWTEFTPTGTEMSTAYSDDVLTGMPPTWSARVAISKTMDDGQGSVPRFAGNGSTNAYISWTRFPNPGVYHGNGDQIAFARSTDNGATWSSPITLGDEFFTIDYILGNDRVHTFSSMAVDKSAGSNKGNIYVVYANNNNHDGSDIYVQRSTDQGMTFSAPQALDSRPGHDRAQWFPYVTVDTTTGRVYVFFYDQGIAQSGDLSETSVTFSDDGGVHWSPPVPLTQRPFNAGWGNDTSQPNLGDYIGGAAQGGELFSIFASTHRPTGGFADGQPGTQMGVPEPTFRRTNGRTDINSVPLALVGSAISYSDSGGDGNIDPGDLAFVNLPVRNYVTNPLNAHPLYNILSHVSTTTTGVKVVSGLVGYGNLAPGAVGVGSFTLQLDKTFVPGTPIELTLFLTAHLAGSATLHYTLFTGTPSSTTLLSENFDMAPAGGLPMGWQAQHGAGLNTVPWAVKTGFCGSASGAAFHADAIDGPMGGDPTRWERLWSPTITAPAMSDYVTVDFDVCYNTEDDPNFNITAYDGLFLRVIDLTTGRTSRPVLAEAFADQFYTGGMSHYPKHLPRGGGNYFSDMSAWAGDSGGVQHVHLRLPGMAGSQFQLRFEYTQDAAGTCNDAGHMGDCGVSIDNVVVQNVVSVGP